MVRVRQDADLPKRDRDMNDRCAVDMYDQLLQGAVRDGRAVNDTDDEEDIEGYVKPDFDKAAAAIRDAEAAASDTDLKRERRTRLQTVRAKPDHSALPPLEQLATEVDVWTGLSVNASSAVPAVVKAKTHRRGGGGCTDPDHTPAAAAPAGQIGQGIQGGAGRAELVE